MRKLTLFFIFLLLMVVALYFYFNFRQKVQNPLKNAQVKGSEAVLKGGMERIPVLAELYFSNHKSYWKNESDNVCGYGGIKSLVEIMNKYSKVPASCVTGLPHPSKTFTVIIPSIENFGFYYCSDQNGFAGLIELNNSRFSEGIKCR